MVGSHAAEFYALRGDEVTVFDSLMRSRLFGYDKRSVEHNWDYLSRFKNIKRISGDIRNNLDLDEAVSGDLDVIIHTASQPSVGFSIANPADDYLINAFGTFNVLEHMRRICKHATFIYCSTNKVYGEHVSDLPLVEKDKRYSFRDTGAIDENVKIDSAPHTPYGVSKYVGDIYTQEYGHIYGIKTGVFRMSCTYGTRQFGFADQGWLNHFIIANVMQRPVTIYGDGKQVRDVLYVGDLIRAFDMFIKADLKNSVFNIGGGPDHTVSLLESIEMIEARTGLETKICFDKWRPSDQKVYISDISKAKNALGWSPTVGLDDGLGMVLDWVKKNKVFFE
ncbi:MAG: hypothetical protein A2Z72_03030 [Omnitrophica bacterium RBG_13_46_9]|nr:MAG: hypothetical protein A2Z72_03030 [Omnitrophica bacterium RBG_13_46_9]